MMGTHGYKNRIAPLPKARSDETVDDIVADSPTSTEPPTAASEGLTASTRIAWSVMFFCLIFLQKIGISLGDSGVSIAVPALYLTMTVLALRGEVTLNPGRLMLYILVVAAAGISQLLCENPFKLTSMLLLFALYLPFVFEKRMTKDNWCELADLFQAMMVVPAAMVFVQLGWQTFLHQPALSLEPVIPTNLALAGYMYEAPIHWGQPLMRPNGFFMLEPSFISAFCAAALILEINLFRRYWRMALYGGALLASTGVTGLVLAFAAAPLLLAQFRKAGILVGVIALVIGAGIIAAQLANILPNRFAELGNYNSSGFGRMVSPLIQLGTIAHDQQHLYTGSGAGTLRGLAQQSSPWPFIHLATEYGFLAGIIFMLLFISSFLGAPNPALAMGLFVVYNFTGGYLLNPILPTLSVLLVVWPSVTAPEPAPARLTLTASLEPSRVVTGAAL